MKAREFLDYLKSRRYYKNQLVHIVHTPAKRAGYGKLKTGLPEPLVKALAVDGTKRLFKHQVQAIEAIRGWPSRGGGNGHG